MATGIGEVTVGDAGLVLSELISNALRHATPLPGYTVRAAWRMRDDRIELAVSDGGGPTAPVANDPGHSAIGGRGLSIVAHLSLRWGVYTAPDGALPTTVWAELPLHCADSPDGAAEAPIETEHVAEGANRSTGPVSGLVTVATWEA